MPQPEKHVFVCNQQRPPGHPHGSCSQFGCAAVYEEFLSQLQDRNLFDMVQLTATGCVGPCSKGRSVLVYSEAVMYSKVKKENVAEILDQHLLGNTPIESLKALAEFW